MNASPGDTILHIALKTKSTAILEWLSKVDGLDLNKENLDGITPSKCAEMEDCNNMYTFFFVFR